MTKIYVNAIRWNSSLVDGPGIRTVVFLQGCDLHCKGCQNPSTWEIGAGTEMTVNELAESLKAKAVNKKVTISGGEPLVQAAAVIKLLDQLQGFDVALYTGHTLEEVPQAISDRVTYLKTGDFQQDKKTSTTPFVGSTNQVFRRMHRNEV